MLVLLLTASRMSSHASTRFLCLFFIISRVDNLCSQKTLTKSTVRQVAERLEDATQVGFLQHNAPLLVHSTTVLTCFLPRTDESQCEKARLHAQHLTLHTLFLKMHVLSLYISYEIIAHCLLSSKPNEGAQLFVVHGNITTRV